MHIEEYLDRIAFQQNVMRVWASWPMVHENGTVRFNQEQINEFWDHVSNQTVSRNNISHDRSNWHHELCFHQEWQSEDQGSDELQLAYKLCLQNIVRHLFQGTLSKESYDSIANQQGRCENNMNAMLDEIYEMFEEPNMEITTSDLFRNLLNERHDQENL